MPGGLKVHCVQCLEDVPEKLDQAQMAKTPRCVTRKEVQFTCAVWSSWIESDYSKSIEVHLRLPNLFQHLAQTSQTSLNILSRITLKPLGLEISELPEVITTSKAVAAVFKELNPEAQPP